MRFGYQRKFSKQIFIDADDSKFFKLLEAGELLPPPPHTHHHHHPMTEKISIFAG